MTDLATLGISVRSIGVRESASDLDRLSAAGGGAERSEHATRQRGPQHWPGRAPEERFQAVSLLSSSLAFDSSVD